MPDPINIDSFVKDDYTYYRLYIQCPVCRQQGRNTPPKLWVHATDDGDVYIGENAKYYCTTCHTLEPIMNWAYHCPEHSKSEDDFVKVEGPGPIADVVASAGALVTKTGIAWLTTLLQNLNE